MRGHDESEIFTTWTTELDEPSVSVVCLCGELDASSAPTFLADMQGIVGRLRHVVMDVHLLEYVDTTGIAAVFSVRTALEGVGRRLCLVGCHGLVSKILRSARLEDQVLRFEDMDQAIAAIESP